MNLTLWEGRFGSARVRRRVSALAVAGLLPASVLTVTAAGTLDPAPATASTSAAADVRTTGTLTVSPSVYVGGQAVRLHGNIGRPGARDLRLQSHMWRPGDVWMDVAQPRFRSDADGDFAVTIAAPSMFDMRFRVVGGGLATEPYVFRGRPQEITLTPLGRGAAYPFHRVLPLVPFTVVADATPDVRIMYGTPPPVPGRAMHLQERSSSGTWRTIATRKADEDGEARFTVAAPLAEPRVLRVRQERWTEGRNRIGSTASFPAFFHLAGTDPLGRGSRQARPATDVARPATDVARPVSDVARPPIATRSPARPTAAERFGWGKVLFDFGWERGRDMDAGPTRGTRRRGRWVEVSDGTGRATQYNGGLFLQSKLAHSGPGDHGTTTTHLVGNSQAKGRWEFRIAPRMWERDGEPYRNLVELVPVGAPATTCSPRSIVVADYVLGEGGLSIGVRSTKSDAVWRRTLAFTPRSEVPFNMAVEVGRRHITWFKDGQVLGTVKGTASQLGVPLTPRLSLVGGREEMAAAQVANDWQRAWPIDQGQQVTSGPSLKRSAYDGDC